MSQADEETAKYTLNNHYNCSRYGQMRMTASNQQVMPLYENCALNINSSNSNHRKADRVMLERSPAKSATFNYDYCFVSNTTNAADVSEQETSDSKSITPEYVYENIHFGGKESLDKKILLQKYFRSALVGPRSNIYENLCRGCNYGVFNARGPLCTFCECIVNGVSALQSDTSEASLTTSNNIYENICEFCGVIYSGANCTECKCSRKQTPNGEENIVKLGSEELLIENSVKTKKKVKINKSKSFSKPNRPRLFTNLWGTLRKPKSAATSSGTRKPLEIIHNVEGYEEVFHTKDTFDLKKICELKRSATSCSDQHIYGRLKQNDLTLSQDEFNSTQSLAQSSNTLSILAGKKPRISKARFLRNTSPQHSESSISSEVNRTELSTATIYLNNSVCQWMTSLRRETYAYNTFNEHDQETLCYPKSIPSKNVLISCKAPAVTNHASHYQNSTQERRGVAEDCCSDLTEILQHTLAKAHNSMPTTSEFWEQQPDYYQLMVEEFMTNILNKQMLKATTTKDKQQQLDNDKTTMAGVSNNDSYTNNNYNCNIDNAIDIPLRQATLTATTTTKTTAAAMTTNNHNGNNISNKQKRQGMYLRLEDHQQLPLFSGEEEDRRNLHNNKQVNKTHDYHHNHSFDEEQNTGEVQRVVEMARDYEFLKSAEIKRGEPDTVTISETLCTCQSEDAETISRCLRSPANGLELMKLNKRLGIHERNILEAFEALFERENELKDQNLNAGNDTNLNGQKYQESQSQQKESLANVSLSLHIHHDNPSSIIPLQTLNIEHFVNHQQISAALNTLVINYDQYLKTYILFIHRITNTNTRVSIVSKIPNEQLLRKFKQFYNYCEKKQANECRITTKTIMRESTGVSSKLKLDLNITNGYKHTQTKAIQAKSNNDSLASASASVEKNTDLKPQENQKVKTPPQVPKRDPKTKLSPTLEINKRLLSNKMTKPGYNLKSETKTEDQKEEESIYQPIWKFETKGKVLERYRAEDDYYDIKALQKKIQQESPNTEIPKILISDEILDQEEEDHNNWEPDEEFVFTKEMKKQRSSSLSSDRISTIRSNHSSNSSIGTSSSLSGSTITEFASSTATLASTLSYSLRHYLFRNIGIFYSLTEPKLRAIIYDYDRIHSSRYFAKPLEQADSGFGKSFSPSQTKKSPSFSSITSPSTSSSSSPVCAMNNLSSHTTSTSTNTSSSTSSNSNNLASSESDRLSNAKAKISCRSASAASLIPSSVQAWKYQLLDVNYMEDEEDMIVSESEILRAQQIKEDIDQTAETQQQPQQFVQRFKSRSTENFLDLPIEDDKKTIAERLANMYTRFSPIQRGILNINGRNSPKSEKKAYKLNRASQSTSLYLEDGLKPKYPIFGAPLDQLELQQNVPRFVVDAVDYIERKDRIIQDGIYRACGNKFSIDELKQKLTKSYIYDSKLITADDIHTVTSLLKQFFRDLPEPVIPQDIYDRITANLSDGQNIDTIRIAIEEMKEPNKSTLRFLVKHLTNVAACSSSNRMNASNVAIVWGPSLFTQNDTYDMIGRMNTLTKVLIENYVRIFDTNERLL